MINGFVNSDKFNNLSTFGGASEDEIIQVYSMFEAKMPAHSSKI